MSSFMRSMTTGRRAGCAALLIGCSLPFVAGADDIGKPRAANPLWQEECGSCHVAYPPGTLPAQSWRRLMGSLAEHFGSDASVDTAQAEAIEAFLVGNARRVKPNSPAPAEAAPLRITEMKWFRSEHRKISAAKWKSPEVGSAANCGACHRRADQGHFDEDDIRIP